LDDAKGQIFIHFLKQSVSFVEQMVGYGSAKCLIVG